MDKKGFVNGSVTVVPGSTVLVAAHLKGPWAGVTG